MRKETMSVVIDEEVSEKMVRLKLNRPEKLNALNSDLLRTIAQKTREANSNGKKVIVFEGAGSAFTSGADLDEEDGKVELFQDITRAVREFDGIVIGKLHGYVIGGGFELTLSFDLRYAKKGTVFKMTESEIGVAISNASTLLLPLTVGAGIARELIFTSRDLGAKEAESHGLVSGVYEKDALESKVMDVAKNIIENKSKEALRVNKRGLNNAYPVDQILDYEELLGSEIRQNTDGIDWE